MQWLENARDWCISRQIWWGHRIPVWYCSNEQCPPIVSREDPTECPHCGNTDVVQDEDVLDTWFSSALWPFSTLGWPDKTPELEAYYPTNTLSTDRGIIYFWVARMVMMGLKMMNDIPFSDVYIHGTILDEQGRKMSKSLGNGIDPLDIISTYGADAMRFSLVVLSTEGQDLKLSESKFEMGRNFCNKLWNATRFAMMNLEGAPDETKDKHRTLADRWILNRLQTTINSLRESMDDYKFSLAAQTLYHFIWNDFCDWYLEATKLAMSDGVEPKTKAASQATLKYVLTESIKLLHPFLPFITEELWQHLNPNSESIMITKFPEASKKLPFVDNSAHFDIARDIISAIRNVRGEHNVKPGQKINAIVKTSNKKQTKVVDECKDYIIFLSRLENLDVGTDVEIPKQAATQVVDDLEVHIPYAGLIDVAAERARVEKEIKKSEGELEGIRRKLSNESFISRAPKDIVDREKERLAAGEDKLCKLNDALMKLD